MFSSSDLKNVVRGINCFYLAIKSRLLAVRQGAAAFSSRDLHNGIFLHVHYQAIENILNRNNLNPYTFPKLNKLNRALS